MRTNANVKDKTGKSRMKRLYQLLSDTDSTSAINTLSTAFIGASIDPNRLQFVNCTPYSYEYSFIRFPSGKVSFTSGQFLSSSFADNPWSCSSKKYAQRWDRQHMVQNHLSAHQKRHAAFSLFHFELALTACDSQIFQKHGPQLLMKSRKLHRRML